MHNANYEPLMIKSKTRRYCNNILKKPGHT